MFDFLLLENQSTLHPTYTFILRHLRSQNLAVAGSADVLDVLRWGDVDTLIMSSDYQPGSGWTCTDCRAIGIEPPKTSICPQCGVSAVRPMDIKEAMLRLAGQLECSVEVVKHSDALMSLGGAGCLLRTHFTTTVKEQSTYQQAKKKIMLS